MARVPPTVLLCASVSMVWWAQKNLPPTRDHQRAAAAGMTPQALQVLAFGHPQTLADTLYLQAVALWGRYSIAPDDYVDLAPLLARTIALDAHYEGAYLLAGTALTLQGMNTQQGMQLLYAGTQLYPRNWRLLFLYGFNAYDLLHDNAAAAASLSAAAVLPGAPPHLPMLAASLSVKAHHPDLGIAMLQTLLQQTNDEAQQESYRRRIAQLQAQRGVANQGPPL